MMTAFQAVDAGSIPVTCLCMLFMNLNTYINLPIFWCRFGMETRNGNTGYGTVFLYAGVAQLAEQLTCNQQVVGSSPTFSFCGKEQLDVHWAHNPEVQVRVLLPLFDLCVCK